MPVKTRPEVGRSKVDMDKTRCGCCVGPIEPKSAPNGLITAGIRLVIAGMGCPNCTMRVRNALLSVDGVADAHVKLVPSVGRVLYDGERVTTEQLIAAVAAAGEGTHHEYSARPLQ